MSGAWDRARAQHGHPLHRDHTEDLETGIASAVREIDEMRAALDRVRALTMRDDGTYRPPTYRISCEAIRAALEGNQP